jgi:hypothetical protein
MIETIVKVGGGTKERLRLGVLEAARASGRFTRGAVDGGRLALRLLGGSVVGRLLVRGALRRTRGVVGGVGRSSRVGEVALGVAIASGLAAGESLYAHPGVQASVRKAGRSLFGLDPGPDERPGEAAATAERIARELHGRGIRPLRLAVDGLPGSGKTTLAAELAERLGLEPVSLEHVDMTRPQDLSRARIIVEHHRLLRTQDLDGFDALVYIDLPVAEILARLHRRERGAFLAALFDFEQMKRIGDLAFRVCDGRSVAIGGGVSLKLRPPGGYGVAERLERLARAQGMEGTASLSREEALFLVANGRAREGLRAYLNQHELRRTLVAAAAAALGFLTRRGR